MYYIYIGAAFSVLIFIFESAATEDDFWSSFFQSVIGGLIWPAIILNLIQLAIRGKLFCKKK